MPFFIPILIGASLLSMIPPASRIFIPQEEKRAQEVIRQDGNMYYNRQGWRTGNPAGTNSNPYPVLQSNKNNIDTDVRKWIIYGGLALVAIITIKFLLRRG